MKIKASLARVSSVGVDDQQFIPMTNGWLNEILDQPYHLLHRQDDEFRDIDKLLFETLNDGNEDPTFPEEWGLIVANTGRRAS